MASIIAAFVLGLVVGWMLRFLWTRWNYYSRSNFGPIRRVVGWRDD